MKAKTLVEMSDEELWAMIGDPKEFAQKSRMGRESHQFLASEWDELVSRYPKEWVAVYEGLLKAHGPTLTAVLSKVDEQGLPRDEVAFGYLDPNPPRLFL